MENSQNTSWVDVQRNPLFIAQLFAKFWKYIRRVGQVNDSSIISHGLFWFNGPLISRDASSVWRHRWISQVDSSFLTTSGDFSMSTKMKSTPILNWLTCMAEIYRYIHSTPNQIKVAELSSVTNPETFEVGRRQKKSEDPKSGGPTDFLRPGYYPLVN